MPQDGTAQAAEATEAQPPTGAEHSIEELDLVSALDAGEEAEETSEETTEKVTEEVTEEKPAAAAAEEETSEEAEDEGVKWYTDLGFDEDVTAIASEFETRDELVDALSAVQKALGIEAVDDWRATITDQQIRNHAANFTSPSDAVEKHFKLRQKLSSAIVPPGKDASSEEKKSFASKLGKMLGVPKEASEYKFPEQKGADLTDEQKQMQAAAQQNWAEFFHGIHLPKSQAEAILSKFATEAAEGTAKIEKADKEYADATEAQLRVEWGEDYDTNRHLAHHALKDLFGDQFDEIMTAKLDNGRFAMDAPWMLRAFAKVGREMREGTMDTLTDTERGGLEEEISGLRARSEQAAREGNSRLANKLYREEQELLKKLAGPAPIVGSGGRAA